MRPNVEYPQVVTCMLDMITASPRTAQLAVALQRIEEPRKGTLLVRHFATRDDLGNAFRVLHALKSIGGEVDRETYRYLMFACCKYSDIDLGLFAMEQMLFDNRPDFRSFKRLFDTCAAQVDKRLWMAYDVMMWFYPLKGFGQNALKTTGYITEVMKMIGMRESGRAGRGFVTLPNPRGEPYDPFVGMFEDDDPNYEVVEGQALERLRLIPEEFEDRNRMAQIVARNRQLLWTGQTDDGNHVAALEQSQWSEQALTAVIKAEQALEQEHIDKLAASRARRFAFDNEPVPSLSVALKAGWKRRMAERKSGKSYD